MVQDVEFVSEAEDLLEAVRIDLAELSERGGDTSSDGDLFNRLFRRLHSLKGLSAAVGLQKAERLAHYLESLLDGLRMGRLQADNHLLDVLSESIQLMDGLIHQRPAAACGYADVLALLEKTLENRSAASRVPPLPCSDLDPELIKSLTAFETHRLQSCFEQGRDVFLISCFFPLNSIHEKLADFEKTLGPHGELVATIPGALGEQDLMEFSLLFCGRIPESVGYCLPAAYRLRVRAVLPRQVSKPEVFTSSSASAGSSPTQMIRIDSATFDELLEISKNLVLEHGQLKRLYQQMMESGVADSKGFFERSFQEMERGLIRLQRSLNDARMIPVRFLFQRMTRVVRTAEKRVGKKVRLEMHGHEVLLDRMVLEKLHEPLLHLVRNAVDHGIESPAERIASGKPAEGTIVLEACRRSGHIAIEVRDDGRGIDVEQVRSRGRALGYIPEGQAFSEQQLYDLLFQPGFTTREEAGELSGRGVGMDVVRCQLESLYGLVEIDSQPGGGTKVVLALPAHKTIMPVLVVSIADRLYALALEGICHVKALEASEHDPLAAASLSDEEGDLPMYDLRGHLHALPAGEGKPGYLVVVGLGDRRAGFVVDGLRGRCESVIRPFDDLLRHIPGFSGVAELIDAESVLLLDFGYLIRAAGRQPQAKLFERADMSTHAESGLLRAGVARECENDISGGTSGSDGHPSSVAEEATIAANERNFISFFLGNREYALDIADVVEIIEGAAWITVPNAPACISGAALWRDHIVPVLDAGLRVGVAESRTNCFGTLIVCNSRDRRVAVVVERLGELFRSVAEVAPDVQHGFPPYFCDFLCRFVLRNERKIGVLSLSAMLDFSFTG